VLSSVTVLPLKKSHPEIMKEESSLKNKERSLNHFFGLNGAKVGVITFLIIVSGTYLLSVRTCRRKPTLVWGQHKHPLLGEKDERQLHEVTCETTSTIIDVNQDSRSVLGQSKGHTSHLKSQQMD
jgi:hypothetical protein